MYKNIKKQCGIAAIEFVLLLPLLLFIGWISVDFGRLIIQYDALTKTTRDAARYLAAFTRPSNYNNDQAYQLAVTQAINLALCGSISACTNTVVPDIGNSNILIDYPASGTPDVTYVRVSITGYNVNFITNDIARLFNNEPLSIGDISVTMRQVQQ